MGWPTTPIVFERVFSAAVSLVRAELLPRALPISLSVTSRFLGAEMEGNPPRVMGWGIDGLADYTNRVLRECSPPRCRWSVRNSFHVLSL